jgi:ABC-type Zn uptake system ZnuABC Zn-binding protein ZnuA
MARVTRCRLWILAVALTVLFAVGAAACGGDDDSAAQADGLSVVAVTTYLADIVQNVAGDRLEVGSLIPEGADAHSFEPSPQDAKLLTEGDVIIRDIEGLTPLVDDLIEASAHEGQVVVDAAAGLTGRPADEEEGHDEADHEEATHDEAEGTEGAEHHHDTGGIDPHFWLDPVNVITYVQNIRQALVAADPDGADVYQANADAYVAKLKELDEWIAQQVDQIPAEHRLLVTNHEEFGYFAARYSIEVVGAVIPSVSSEASPSAQQLSTLISQIKATGAPAIFLEAGSNTDLADEVAREAGVTVVDDLYTHSVSKDAPTYIDMMRWNTNHIVEALR